MSELQHSPQSKVILIVEDRPVMGAMLREFVQNAFPAYTILGATDGAEAMKLLALHQPSLVLMDISLRDAHGLELTALMTKTLPKVAVIVISYLQGPVYVEQAQAAGACAYVVKDRLLTDLIPAMAAALHTAGTG